MFFSKLKISVKLIISSLVFLIPIGVMIFFISSITFGTIRRSQQIHYGITSLKPVVWILQVLPEYLDMQLGLNQGNIRNLHEGITAALIDLDREINRYRENEINFSNFQAHWHKLTNVDRNNTEIYQQYFEFAFNLISEMIWLGEKSGINLVNDMNTYYFVAASLSLIPEAYNRQITIANIIRKNLFEAEDIVNNWNSELSESHALGRRLNTALFEDDPRHMPFSMINFTDMQLVMNSNLLISSDRDRILSGVRSAMEGGSEEDYHELLGSLYQYEEGYNLLAEQFSRIWGFNIINPTTVYEFMEAMNSMHYGLTQVWAMSLEHLDILTRQNTVQAQRQLILYLSIVLVSLGIAIVFVVFISRDINISVKSLRKLFKGLNENDLTMSLPINSRDEFGELMTAFNGFLNILRSTFGSFKESAQLVADSVFDISSSSKEITTTANEQSTSVSEIVSTMESSKNLSEQIAIKTTEVANLAQETQELSSKGADLREANQDMMEDIRKQNQKIINEIRNLSDMIIRISEAIRIIDSIADQTKLIAFNASLEASSSGEAGARFSVVAAEIRRFADNVAESTFQIKQRIEEVQEASQTLIAEANNGSRQIEIGYERMSEQKIVFENIVDNSQNVATRSQQISNLSRQQELASSQIFTALKEISAGIKQFVVATSSTSGIADSLNGMSVDLKDRVEKYKTDKEEV